MEKAKVLVFIFIIFLRRSALGGNDYLRYMLKTVDLCFGVGGLCYLCKKKIQMLIKRTSLLLSALLFGLNLLAQLTLRVTSIPVNTPAGDNIFVAGSFNGWDPGNAAYMLQPQGGQVYAITINPPAGNLQFKFTRGSWQTVEGNASGGFLPNRTYNYSGGVDTVSLQILSWEGGGGSTAASNVSILSQSFFMPQLNRNRRIWIYLPPDYEDSGKDYPVLYMQDGQNVFDATTAFAGEWEVDESLNQLFDEGDKGVIVVAIDNGGANRINEYSPWVNPSYGGGQGAAYVDFIVETLKPYVDDNFRTLPGREHTGIMGSSMGGLISLYAAIEHQQVFSKAGVFSASFWFSSQSYAHVTSTGKQADMRIYLIAGQLEGSSGGQVADMNTMYNTLRAAGFSADEVLAVAHADGQHSEWYWAREFPDAYEWLFRSSSTAVSPQLGAGPLILLAPNPADTQLQLISPISLAGMDYEIRTAAGALLQARRPLPGTEIPLQGLAAGVYLLSVYQQGQLLFSERFVKQ
jgi:predicted alpha/beta superfamily hydrolase